MKLKLQPRFRILQNQKGQGLIEYLLLTALLAIGTMAVVRLLGNSVAARYADVVNAVQGASAARTHVDRVQESQYKKRDMSDFMRGAVKRGDGGSSRNDED